MLLKGTKVGKWNGAKRPSISLTLHLTVYNQIETADTDL
jgi:hypothetical protein